MQEITKCRVCGGEIKSIFSLGKLAVSTFTKLPNVNLNKCPLELVLCQKCDLLQLKHSAPQEFLYTLHYWYKSAMNPVIVEDLKDIANKAIEMVGSKPYFSPLKPGDVFLDIGANDGTLLSFVPDKYKRIGVEPATNLLDDLKANCDEYSDKFWEDCKFDWKAKIITAIGMFYDSEDPNKFISNVKKHLAKDGLFIAQLMTLAPMVRNNDVSNICHEHLEYYSYPALKYLFENNDLEIFKVEENSINGGSYRLYAKHRLYLPPQHNGRSIEYLEKINLKKFIKNVKKNKKKTVEFIKQANARGKNVYGYGASTKGNTILQYYGLNSTLLKGIADKDEEKWGKYTVETNIPIVSEKEAREKADYFFILPWGFTKSFLKREEEWRKIQGQFIVSIPRFRILS